MSPHSGTIRTPLTIYTQIRQFRENAPAHQRLDSGASLGEEDENFGLPSAEARKLDDFLILNDVQRQLANEEAHAELEKLKVEVRELKDEIDNYSPSSSTMDRLELLTVPDSPISETKSKRAAFYADVLKYLDGIKPLNSRQRDVEIAKLDPNDRKLFMDVLRVADAGVRIDTNVIDQLDTAYQTALLERNRAELQALFGESATPSPTTPTSAASVESYISANGDGPSFRHVPRRPGRRFIVAPRGEFTFRVDRQMFDDMMVVGAELEPGDIGNRKRKVRSIGKAIKRQRTTVAPPVRKMKGAINSFRNYDTLRS